jgi:hypothetical protein
VNNQLGGSPFSEFELLVGLYWLVHTTKILFLNQKMCSLQVRNVYRNEPFLTLQTLDFADLIRLLFRGFRCLTLSCQCHLAKFHLTNVRFL